MAINPDECIDCGVCIPECPVEAIIPDTDANFSNMEFWLKLNTELSQSGWPRITQRKDALPNAEEWKNIPDKLQYLEK